MKSTDHSLKFTNKHLYYFLTVVLALSFFILIFADNGYPMRGVLAEDRDRAFMDFFDGLLSLTGNPYENGSVETPFALLFFKVILKMVPDSTIARVMITPNSGAFGTVIKLRQESLFPMMLMALTVLILLYFGIQAMFKDAVRQRVLFQFLFFFSAPFLFLGERMNLFALTLTFLVLFFADYNSDNRLLREFSLVFLGISAAFGVFPLLFLVFLLEKKRGWDALKVLGYFLVLTAVPLFLFFGGLTGLELLLSNMGVWARETAVDVTGHWNFFRLFLGTFRDSGFATDSLLGIGRVFAPILGGLSLAASFFVKKDWQRVALLCCVICGLLPGCETFHLTVFAIPAVLLLTDEADNGPVGYLGAAFLALTQALIPSLDFKTHAYGRQLLTLITGYSVVFLAILLIVAAACSIFSKISQKGQKEAKQS